MSIKVRKFKYKVTCDFRGCTNMATYSIGDERVPQSLMFNYCDSCVQEIVNAVPKEFIKKRYDIEEIAKEVCANIGQFEFKTEYEKLNMNILREKAKEFGVPLPVGITKNEAIETLYNLEKGVKK